MLIRWKIVIIKEFMKKNILRQEASSIHFMSPINVHVTRYCVSGKIKFSKYHPGKYLVAWHQIIRLNERTTIVISNNVFGEILYRQIAGACTQNN